MGSTTKVDIPSLIKQLNSLKPSDTKDPAARKSLYEAARRVAFALELPGDTIHRISHTSLQTTVARIGSDLHLFEILSKQDDSTSTRKLAESTGADEMLLGRILRYLASFGMIEEVGEDQWAASEITKTLSMPGLKAWDLPLGHRTEQAAFEWALSVPSRFDNFNLWMAANREGQNIFLDVYPFEKELCHGLEPDTPLFVDVGGGIGHQCLALKQRFPHVPGRVINEDLPPVIAQAIPCDGVEHMVYNFMTPQPVKGARAYYMRNVMHDYPDEKCAIILRQIMDVMDKHSVILIDDMVLPNEGAHWRQTQLDLLVMAGLAAIERTEKQWYSMLDAAGLKVKYIYTYTPELRDSIIVAVPK
ncbi:hypothetical protein JMJ35_005871 [Cladonia borealis]|uniref:O-methyltransferase n=1 Tax=Cladonia borealis TaxID=184061 RepID=A0AA39R0X0_9LECA|nr:hypothetical protein JMJ35_005871 [Cladonia borealis]